jgi:hypothetical protein
MNALRHVRDGSPHRRRSAATSVAALLAAAVIAGCTTDAPAAPSPDAPTVDHAADVTGPGPSTPTVPAPDGPLPPNDTDGLAVEPLLAALYAESGTLLTRGALIDRRTLVTSREADSYGPRETIAITRPHLALYLAFVDEDLDDLDRYLDAIVPLTHTFAAAAFERWPDLESFDICLVPASDSDASPEPAIALVDVTRDGYARWAAGSADLAGLLEFTQDHSSGVRVQFTAALGELLTATPADLTPDTRY